VTHRAPDLCGFVRRLGDEGRAGQALQHLRVMISLEGPTFAA
jgi:hypothetical protein